MDCILTVQNLSVSYGSNKILDNINFEVTNGEFIAIVGKSGSGKTTLLNTLPNFIKYSGIISVYGSIGFCFQSHSLFYWMTVEENIGFGITHVSGNEKKQIVKDILKRIDLEKYANVYPKELSGGQTQRVALGRAIACNPKILILDEPFSSLDIYTRDQMIDWVLKLISQLNITVFMVTHYLDEALILADRIFVLKDQNIEAVIPVNFLKPRKQEIRFTEEFQKCKQELSDLINDNKE